MKKALHLVTLLSLLTTPAFAGEDTSKTAADPYPLQKNISGTLAFVSNYVFRGVSQTRNLPALQGGLTYTTPYNFYGNLWGSNVRFEDTSATLEFDTILGYRNTYGDDFAYDLNLARYNYPGARYLNYNEANGIFNFKFIQFGVSYSANVYNVHQSGTYYTGGINYDIPSQWIGGVCDVNLLALIGHYSLPRAAGNSYNDYNVTVSKSFNKYHLAVQWTNTDGRQHNAPYDSQQIIGQLSVDV